MTGAICFGHKKNIKKYKCFWANCSCFVSEREIRSWKWANPSLCFLVKCDKSDSLMVALFKERHELFAHSCSFKRAILSKRAKRKEQKCEEWKSKFPTLSKTNERYPFKGPYFQKNTRGKILKKVISLILSHKIGYKKVFCKPI